jgi:LemA protein
MTVVLVIVGILVAFVGFLISIYNKLVTMRNRYRNAYSQIDVQLKRRYDLIPNLVQTAKGYLKHEQETLQAVIEARSGAVKAAGRAAADPGNPAAMGGLAGAEGLLTGALGRLMVVAEQYPDLKGDKVMTNLSEELSSTENRVAFARQAFNDSVMTFNTAIEVFPNSIIAGMGNFQKAVFFEIEKPEEREVVAVDLG